MSEIADGIGPAPVQEPPASAPVVIESDFSPRKLKIAELPYSFGVREHGESKLDTLVLWEYIALLIDKTIGRYVPALGLETGSWPHGA